MADVSPEDMKKMMEELERLRRENVSLKKEEGSQIQIGKHGEQSRFLPGAKLEPDMYSPRVVPLVGKLGEVRGDEFKAVNSLGRRYKPGKIVSSPIVGDENVRYVVVPGSSVVSNVSLPVAVTSSIHPPEAAAAATLGKLPDSVLLIERDEEMFENGPNSTYLYNTADGLKLGVVENADDADQVECLGELVISFSLARKELDPE